MDVPQPGVALGDPGERVNPVQQVAQLLLARLGQQEVVERLEGPALIRAGDRLPAAEHVVEQLALAAVPAGDLLPELPVQLAEVLLHLAEVSEQLPGGRGELLVAVAHRALVEQVNLARLDAGDLLVEGLPLAPQLGEPLPGSVSVPKTICRSKSKITFSRDSVPTNSRSCRLPTHCSAFSTAGVASKCGSSVPSG